MIWFEPKFRGICLEKGWSEGDTPSGGLGSGDAGGGCCVVEEVVEGEDDEEEDEGGEDDCLEEVYEFGNGNVRLGDHLEVYIGAPVTSSPPDDDDDPPSVPLFDFDLSFSEDSILLLLECGKDGGGSLWFGWSYVCTSVARDRVARRIAVPVDGCTGTFLRSHSCCRASDMVVGGKWNEPSRWEWDERVYMVVDARFVCVLVLFGMGS